MPYANPLDQKAYYQKNKKRLNEASRIWKSKHKEKSIEQERNWRLNNPRRYKHLHLKNEYGITFEQMKQMYVSQNGCCAICGKRFIDRKDMKIDHDHETGNVRQILCNSCNCGIGFFNDDIQTMLKAIEYINKWKGTICQNQ